jgi:hypothetical protein
VQAIIDRIKQVAETRPEERFQLSKAHLTKCSPGCKVESECKRQAFKGGKFVTVDTVCLVRAQDFVDSLQKKQPENPPVKTT